MLVTQSPKETLPTQQVSTPPKQAATSSLTCPPQLAASSVERQLHYLEEYEQNEMIRGFYLQKSFNLSKEHVCHHDACAYNEYFRRPSGRHRKEAIY
jgi:hypothetical protein